MLVKFPQICKLKILRVVALPLVFGTLCALAQPAMAAALKVGDAVPAFRLTTASGSIWSQRKLKKFDLSVVYFFSTKCKECVEGLKHLQSMNKDFIDQKRAIIAVGKQSPAEIKRFADQHKLSIPLLSGSKDVLKAFKARYVFPTTYLVGPNQKIINSVQGGSKAITTMLLALGERSVQRKQFAAARDIYAKIEKVSDESGKARAGKAYSLLKEGKLAGAETTFAQMSTSSTKEVSLKGKEGLAEVYLQQGKAEKAIALADQVIKQAPKRTAALLAKGKALHQQGKKQEAAAVIGSATSKGASSDFSWQRAEAHFAKGNLNRENKHAKVALVSYEQAVEIDPYFVDAMSNQGVALQDLGEPQKALDIFKKMKNINPKDRLVYSLMRQAQAAIAQKQDIERQKYIDGLVSDLLTQFKENKKKKKGPEDDWTSPVLAISILGFQDSSKPMLMGRAGLEGVLQEELTRELLKHNIKVVERAIIDKLLSELKMGSSDLTDEQARLKLGKIMSARAIISGSISTIGKSKSISFRMIDTETTNIVASLAERQSSHIDPIAVAQIFAEKIAKVAHKKYPLKGRIVYFDEDDADSVMINLGEKHGVTEGLVFNVFRKKMIPIKHPITKKILKYKKKKAGQLEITEVSDAMTSMAKVKSKKGNKPWEVNQLIQIKRQK